MDAFYEEDERIVGHAADSYHRIDIRQSSRNLVVRHRDRIIADTKRPVVLYESGFAPRWYVPRADIDESALTPVEHQTFCPYKGLCSYYDIGDARLAAWSYPDAYPEVGRISNLVSFEPDIVSVQLDGTQLHLEPGQTVIPHGPDRDLDVAEVSRRTVASPSDSAARTGHQAERHGSTTIGERRTSARHRVEGSHCAHRDLEESGAWPLSGRPVESGRRRSRRPGRARG